MGPGLAPASFGQILLAAARQATYGAPACTPTATRTRVLLLGGIPVTPPDVARHGLTWVPVPQQATFARSRLLTSPLSIVTGRRARLGGECSRDA